MNKFVWTKKELPTAEKLGKIILLATESELWFIGLEKGRADNFWLYQYDVSGMHNEEVFELLSADISPRLLSEVPITWVSDCIESVVLPLQAVEKEDYPFFLYPIFGVKDYAHISKSTIEGWQMQAIFTYPSYLSVFSGTNSEITSSLKYLIPAFNKTSPMPAAQLLFRNGWYSILIIKDNRILLCQNYPLQSATDVLYQLLQCLAQYDIANTEIRVDVGGAIVKNSNLYETLLKYFPHLHFSKTIDYLPEALMGDTPVHTYALINTILACEL